MKYKNFDEMYESMNLDELVDWINTYHLDIFEDDFTQIYRMDNNDVWSRIVEKIGINALYRNIMDIDLDADFFVFDETSGVMESFSDKAEVLSSFTKEQLDETFDEMN